MPKQQASLDSFFGVKNKNPQQKTLTSFFKTDKENKKNDDNEEEEVVVKAHTKRESPTKQVSIKRRRQAIVDSDDDDDDDDEPVPMQLEKAIETKQEEKPKDEKESKTSAAKSPTPPPPKQEETQVKAKEEDNKDEVPPETPSNCPHRAKLVKQATKLAKAAKVPTTVDELTSTPVLYQDLVETLEKIEAIAGRLEIQKLLTTLFRRTLQSSPKDLYPIVYLASNSIAPAYECVELGIGDSILIKAIGEAYGTNPCK